MTQTRAVLSEMPLKAAGPAVVTQPTQTQTQTLKHRLPALLWHSLVPSHLSLWLIRREFSSGILLKLGCFYPITFLSEQLTKMDR